MGFFRQECWSGLSFPSPGDLSNPGIEPGSPALQADALSSEPPGKHLTPNLTLFLSHRLTPRVTRPTQRGDGGEENATELLLLREVSI